MHLPKFLLALLPCGVLSTALAQPTSGSQASSGTGLGDLENLLRQDDAIAPVSRVMGYRIIQSAVKPYAHGTMAIDWRWRGGGTTPTPNTFELREAHLYFGAFILNIAQPEVFVQFEQSSPTDPPVSLRYAQLDIRAYKELLVFRAGMFLVPFGVYNTDLFLRYVAKLPERPEIHNRVMPSAGWKEVGVQARGRWEWERGRALTYAIYVTNGLSLQTTSTTQIVFLPALRDAAGGKTVGARIGIEPFEGLSIGFSAYDGAVDGKLEKYRLIGLDAVWRYGRFSMDGEVVTGEESANSATTLTKQGFYIAAGYKITDWFEPVASTERINALPGYQSRDLWGGFNIYPFPESFPTIVLKGAYGRRWPTPGASSDRVTIMLVIGY